MCVSTVREHNTLCDSLFPLPIEFEFGIFEQRGRTIDSARFHAKYKQTTTPIEHMLVHIKPHYTRAHPHSSSESRDRFKVTRQSHDQITLSRRCCRCGCIGCGLRCGAAAPEQVGRCVGHTQRLSLIAGLRWRDPACGLHALNFGAPVQRTALDLFVCCYSQFQPGDRWWCCR